jgi:hypothetical protein
MTKARFDQLVDSLAKLSKVQRSIVVKCLAGGKHFPTSFYQFNGRSGGKATSAQMTKEAKHLRAVKAAEARWRPKANVIEDQPIFLQFCKSSDITDFESRHYVRKLENGEPRGHHGQQCHYIIWYKGAKVGAISGGSAVYTTRVRDQFFGITPENREKVLPGIIDNTLFRLECNEPNLATRVLAMWRKQVVKDWEALYGIRPFGLETFVEYEDRGKQQRTGNLYDADNWDFAGCTQGTAKSHENGLTGAVTREPVPAKLVFCKWIGRHRKPLEYDYSPSWRGGTTEEKALARALRDKREELLYLAGRKTNYERDRTRPEGEKTS